MKASLTQSAGKQQPGTPMLGIPIGPKPLSVLQEEAASAINLNHTQIVFACANPHSLVEAGKDAIFADALKNADQVVADGVGVSLVARLLSLDIGPRITGSDYFKAIMQQLNAKGGGRVFFFGSTPHVLNLISQRVQQDYPGLTVAGTLSPPYRPFSEQENLEWATLINQSKADVLWVGMTAPKQEKWVFENRERLTVPVIGSIGAVFDFYAGTYPRAPLWMTKCGLEWLYRLVSEPKRMWRRNFISTPVFLWRSFRQHGLAAIK